MDYFFILIIVCFHLMKIPRCPQETFHIINAENVENNVEKSCCLIFLLKP